MQEEFMTKLENIILKEMKKGDRSVFLSFEKDGGFTVSIDPRPVEVDKGEQDNAMAFDCALENCHEVGLDVFPVTFVEKIRVMENDEEDSPPQKNRASSLDS